VSFPSPDLSPPPAAYDIADGPDGSTGIETRMERPIPDAFSRDGLVLQVLALLNGSADLDSAMGQALDRLTEALDGRVGEIWLIGDATDHVELQYSSSDGSPAVAAFEAAGRALGPGPGPSMIARVVKTGRESTVSLVVADGRRERAVEAAGAGIQGALTFPIGSREGIVGVLAVFRESITRPAPALHDAASLACVHLGQFIERVRAAGSVHTAEAERSALASTDSLTGLRNRQEFVRALQTVPALPFAVLSVDVDGLSGVNDAHGHIAGDALLRHVGQTLGVLLRGHDVIARVGGDEFAALLPEINVFGAEHVAERMRVAMHALLLPSGPVRLTVGWSAACAGADPVSVWRKADESLSDAKRAGGDRVIGQAYEPAERVELTDRSHSDVVATIFDGGALSTMFQPIVHLVDGSVVGYEALARPEGFAATDSVEALFAAARSSGQIRELDWLCLQRAIEDARMLPADAVLFLNISAATLMDPGRGVEELIVLLQAAGRSPRTVVLEITEHEQIRDYDALSKILVSYRAEGIRFALDDVGEGHATLELLAASASEYLKLGRSLTMTSTEAASRAAMNATMTFALLNGGMVIAEGVENEFVSDQMQAAGILLGQGFGLGKPTPAAEVKAVAEASAGRAALAGSKPITSSYRQ
jgi:diguanylate cyclase (GGDEF)-like protein